MRPGIVGYKDTYRPLGIDISKLTPKYYQVFNSLWGEGMLLDHRNETVPLDRLFYMYKNKRVVDPYRDGIYVIANKTNGKIYVGMADEMLYRIFDGHFNGYGNKGVFKDWLKGHKFDITCIPYYSLDQSLTLRENEKEIIRRFNLVESNQSYNIRK